MSLLLFCTIGASQYLHSTLGLDMVETYKCGTQPITSWNSTLSHLKERLFPYMETLPTLTAFTSSIPLQLTPEAIGLQSISKVRISVKSVFGDIVNYL